MLTIQEPTPQRPGKLGRIGSLSDALPASATAARSALGRLSSPDPFSAILFACRGDPGIGGLQPARNDLPSAATAFLVFITQRLALPLTTLGRPSTTTSGDGLQRPVLLDLLATPMAIPSGDRPLPTQEGQREAWNSARSASATAAAKD